VLVLEEKLLDDTGIDEVSEVGIFGAGSFATTLLMMPFAGKIRCKAAWCKYGYLDDIKRVWIDTDAFILGSSLVYGICFLIYELSGIVIIRGDSAVLRCILDNVVTVLVWVMSLYMRWESANLIDFIGFIVILIGLLHYEKIKTRRENGYEDIKQVASN